MCVFLLLPLGMALLVGASVAFAVSKVSSPQVNKDALEIEGRYGFDQDGDPAKDDVQNYNLSANYGFTERVRGEFKTSFSNPPDENFDFTGWDALLRWQFFKPDEAWLSSALDVDYEFTENSDDPDALQLRVLVRKNFPEFNHTANLGVKQQIGNNSDSSPVVISAWQSVYKYSPEVMPGFEFFGNNSDGITDFEENQYQLGPILTGTVLDAVKYDVGYLFGLTSASTEGEFKLILTYRHQF